MTVRSSRGYSSSFLRIAPQRREHFRGAVHLIDSVPEAGRALHAVHIPGDVLSHLQHRQLFAIQLRLQPEVALGHRHPFGDNRDGSLCHFQLTYRYSLPSQTTTNVWNMREPCGMTTGQGRFSKRNLTRKAEQRCNPGTGRSVTLRCDSCWSKVCP